MKKDIIPTHDFYDKLERSIPFDSIQLKEKSTYDPSVPHRHSYYEIFFFVKGGGTHEIDFETFSVESNSLHFVSPGQTHLLQRALNSNGHVLLFSREFFHLGLQNKDSLYELPFLNNNTSKPIVAIPGNEHGLFNDLFQKIQSEYSSANPYKEEVLRSYLNILLIHSKRLFKMVPEEGNFVLNSGKELAKKFKIAIEKNFISVHRVGEYADMLHVSPGHLNDIVQKNTGKSAGELIHERLILEIKRMLLHSDETINEIAYVLNFEDPSYFTRFFRKHSGVSPTDFRTTIRKKYH